MAKQEIQESLQLRHALIISEHDALLHTGLDQDFMLSTLMAINASTDKPTPTGLPADFVSGNDSHKRFWLLLGVQIHHAAVRQRIGTLLSMLPQGSAPAPLRKSHRAGVAINHNSTAPQRDVLFWNGIDVVGDYVQEFIGDLEHLSQHARHEERFVRGHCRV